MNKKEIIQWLDLIFTEVLDKEIKLSETSTSTDIEEWDSINHITLMMEIENKMNIKFTASEMHSLQNIGELCILIEKKMKN